MEYVRSIIRASILIIQTGREDERTGNLARSRFQFSRAFSASNHFIQGILYGEEKDDLSSRKQVLKKIGQNVERS